MVWASCAEATGAAPARPLEADEDTAASPSGPASKRPRRTAARASDGPGDSWRESARGASEHEEAVGSAGSSVPSCSESDDDEEFLQKVCSLVFCSCSLRCSAVATYKNECIACSEPDRIKALGITCNSANLLNIAGLHHLRLWSARCRCRFAPHLGLVSP